MLFSSDRVDNATYRTAQTAPEEMGKALNSNCWLVMATTGNKQVSSQWSRKMRVVVNLC